MREVDVVSDIYVWRMDFTTHNQQHNMRTLLKTEYKEFIFRGHIVKKTQ